MKEISVNTNDRGVHMPNWLPESQMESATLFPGIPVESATCFLVESLGIPGIPWNPRFCFFLWNPGIQESWNPGNMESWNPGIGESWKPRIPESFGCFLDSLQNHQIT